MKEKKAKRSSGGISWIFGYLGFGVGAIGMDLSYGLFNSFLTKYLTDVLLLNATFLLIVPTLARIWDGINDPMMGTIVDNTKSKFGKFRPWIMCGAVLNAVALTFLFTNPGFEVSRDFINIKLYIYAAVMYVLWGMTNTMIDIPYWSMVPALTSDPQKRNVVSAIPRFFSGFGQIIVSVFTVQMVAMLGKGNDSVGYSRWAMIAGIVLIIGALITVTTTKERGSVPPKEKFTLAKAFKTVKSNDQLLVFMLTALLFNTGWYITNAMGIYFFDNVMGNRRRRSGSWSVPAPCAFEEVHTPQGHSGRDVHDRYRLSRNVPVRSRASRVERQDVHPVCCFCAYRLHGHRMHLRFADRYARRYR